MAPVAEMEKSLTKCETTATEGAVVERPSTMVDVFGEIVKHTLGRSLSLEDLETMWLASHATLMEKSLADTEVEVTEGALVETRSPLPAPDGMFSNLVADRPLDPDDVIAMLAAMKIR